MLWRRRYKNSTVVSLGRTSALVDSFAMQQEFDAVRRRNTTATVAVYSG